jgi:hypothetical protein
MPVAEFFQRPWRELWVAITLAALIPWLVPAGSQDRGVQSANRAILAHATIGSHADVSLAALRARPLFDPSRRPKPVAKPPVPARIMAPFIASVPPKIAGYVLLGTVVSPGIQTALIRRPASASAEVVHLNTMIGPWAVTSIETSHVMLRAGLLTVQLGFPDLRLAPAGPLTPPVTSLPPSLGPPFDPRH